MITIALLLCNMIVVCIIVAALVDNEVRCPVCRKPPELCRCDKAHA